MQLLDELVEVEVVLVLLLIFLAEMGMVVVVHRVRHAVAWRTW
jgi:hypothetical protein